MSLFLCSWLRWAFSSCGRRGFPALLAPHCSGPFIAHGVQICLGLRASAVAARGLYSASSVAVEHGLSCSVQVEPSRARDQTCVPTLAGRFLSTAPSGKSLAPFLEKMFLPLSTSPDVRNKQTTCLHVHFWILLCPATCWSICLTAVLQLSLFKNVYLLVGWARSQLPCGDLCCSVWHLAP